MRAGQFLVLTVFVGTAVGAYYSIVQPYYHREEWRKRQQDIDMKTYMKEHDLSNPQALPKWEDVFQERRERR